MKLWERYQARRRRKAHEAREQEQARQKALSQQDAQQAVRDLATKSGPAQATNFPSR
jgi:hypothetical protein